MCSSSVHTDQRYLPKAEPRWYVHKFAVSLAYGGPEEGGWWYTIGVPVLAGPIASFTSEDDAFAFCREQNVAERERREREEQYDFTSVLSHRSDHYEYDVSELPVATPFPAHRPHYE